MSCNKTAAAKRFSDKIIENKFNLAISHDVQLLLLAIGTEIIKLIKCKLAGNPIRGSSFGVSASAGLLALNSISIRRIGKNFGWYPSSVPSYQWAVVLQLPKRYISSSLPLAVCIWYLVCALAWILTRIDQKVFSQRLSALEDHLRWNDWRFCLIFSFNDKNRTTVS